MPPIIKFYEKYDFVFYKIRSCYDITDNENVLKNVAKN